MARPVTITTEQILDAARAAFLEHGFDATTAQIAKKAGVSEGSLFKRYKDKEALFFAAMELPTPPFQESITGLAGQGEVLENLNRIALGLVGFFTEMLPKSMLLWSNPGAHGKAPSARPIQGLKRFGEYLAAEMALGRVRKSDPDVFARLIAGALWQYCFLRLVFEDRTAAKPEEFARQVVAQLWKGMKP